MWLVVIIDNMITWLDLLRRDVRYKFGIKFISKNSIGCCSTIFWAQVTLKNYQDKIAVKREWFFYYIVTARLSGPRRWESGYLHWDHLVAHKPADFQFGSTIFHFDIDHFFDSTTMSPEPFEFRAYCPLCLHARVNLEDHFQVWLLSKAL